MADMTPLAEPLVRANLARLLLASVQASGRPRCEIAREVRLQPIDRVICRAHEEEQQLRPGRSTARSQDSEAFAQAGGPLADQHPPQRVLMYLGIARDVAARTSAGLDGREEQLCEVGSNEGLSKRGHVRHQSSFP